MVKRRTAPGIVVLALLGGVVGLIAFFMPREPQLLKRAAFVARTEPWHQGERFRNDVGVHWLSDDALLVSRFEGPGGADRVVYRYNVKTRREEKLPSLTEARNDFPAEVVDSQGVSPDGGWFVCSSRWDTCLLSEVNGRHHYTYPSANDDAYRSLLWMPDGHHWLENYVLNGESHRLLLHDTEHPQSSISLPLAGKKELFGALYAVVSPQEGIAVVDSDPPTDGIDSAPVDPLNPHVLTISRVALDAHTQPIAQYRVAVPSDTARYDLHVSPQGDRIAWQVTTIRADIWQRWLHRYLPFVRRKVQPRAEVWICNLDGSNMHEAGSIVEPPAEDDGSSLRLSLQWLPGGKRLSFEYEDALYTIPAD